VEHLNQTYSNNQDIYFALNDIQNVNFCETPGKKCEIPFPEYPTDLRVSVDNNRDFLDILYFPNFLDNFNLDNAVGKCTNNQLENARWPPNLSLINYCVCCDDYEQGSQCPNNPWLSPGTASPPISTTNQPVVTQSQTIDAYYIGKLKADSDPGFNVQIQLKIVADITEQRIRATVEHINETYVGSELPYLHLYTSERSISCQYSKDCSIEFTLYSDSFFEVHIHNGENTAFYGVMHFDSFDNTFVLNKPSGGCTKSQTSNANNPPDPAFSDYCICYDSYKEKGALNCPYNPWSH